MPSRRSKHKKHRKQRKWGNDSVERIERRIASMEEKVTVEREKLTRLRQRDRLIVERWLASSWGDKAQIAEDHGISRSALHRIVRRFRSLPESVEQPERTETAPEEADDQRQIDIPNPQTDGARDDQLVNKLYRKIETLESEVSLLGEELDDLREEHSACEGNAEEFSKLVEDWMYRLQAPHRVMVRAGKNDDHAEAARELRDLIWDMEKWLG